MVDDGICLAAADKSLCTCVCVCVCVTDRLAWVLCTGQYRKVTLILCVFLCSMAPMPLCLTRFVTTRSELHKVLFLALSVTFLFVYEISRELWMDLCQIHMEDVFGPSHGQFWMSRSKVKITREKTSCFGPFVSLHVVSVWLNIFSL